MYKTISFIIPVYNVEKYLNACVDSILDQITDDCEIILVDDGSADSSGTICDKYAEEDSRVKVVHQKNGGLAAARNTGLDYAQGEYVAFVDSDDYLAMQCIPEILNWIASSIAEYKKLSVREDSALDVLHQLGRDDGVQLIDPTLQLTKDEWLRLASPRLVKQPYLILMLLYNEDNHATEYARRIADEKGLKLVKISWEMKKPPMVDQLFTHRSPADFLSLFANADFVVTNSFHGLAFSINLERQFIVVPRNEFNSRIESLLTLTGLQEHLVSTPEAASAQSGEWIDYVEVEKRLDIERERAKEYIESLRQL